MKTRHTAIPAVYLVLEKEGKILLARRCNTGYQDGSYSLPAGHVEEGELPTETLVREAREEIGVIVLAHDLVFAHMSYWTKSDNTGDRVNLFFKTHKWVGDIVNNEPKKCDDLKWADLHDLPSNFTPEVRDAIDCIKKGIFFRELGV